MTLRPPRVTFQRTRHASDPFRNCGQTSRPPIPQGSKIISSERYDLAPLRPWLGPAAKPNRSAKIEPLACNGLWLAESQSSHVRLRPPGISQMMKASEARKRRTKLCHRLAISLQLVSQVLLGGPLRHAHKRGGLKGRKVN